MDQKKSGLLNILVVEDNPGDVYLLQECFNLVESDINLIFARDGRQALDILFSEDKIAAQKPDMVLLDLNLPAVNGRELLLKIRNSPSLSSLPVAILTSSDNQEDIRYCRSLGIFSYFIKPDDIEELLIVVKNIEDFLLRKCCRF